MKKKSSPQKNQSQSSKIHEHRCKPPPQKKLTAGKTQKIVFEMLQNGPKIVEKNIKQR